MSGYYSRKLYDHCDLGEQRRISIGEGNYRISTDPLKNKRCAQPMGVGLTRDNIYNPTRQKKVGTMIKLDSHLRNLDEVSSNCDSSMTEKNKRAEMIYGEHQRLESCNSMLQSSYSRMENPAIDVRSMCDNRFGFPIQDHRYEIFHGFQGTNQFGDMRFGIDSRADAKDSDPNEYMARIDDYSKRYSTGPNSYNGANGYGSDKVNGYGSKTYGSCNYTC